MSYDETMSARTALKRAADIKAMNVTLVAAAEVIRSLRAQNAELLAALRECANSLESEASAREFDGHSTIHAARAARNARAAIAKAEDKS